MNQIKPTYKMINYCEKISRNTGIELPEGYDTSFQVARRFLDQYAYFIGFNQAVNARRDDPSQDTMGSNIANEDTDSASDNIGKLIHNFRKLFLLFFSGCLMLLVSTGLTSLFNLDANNAVSILLGIMAVFGMLMVFFALGILMCTLPFLSIEITRHLFLRVRICICRLIIITCLVWPRTLAKIDPAF